MSQEHPFTFVERFDALYEFDREPVSDTKLDGSKSFIALLVGEPKLSGL